MLLLLLFCFVLVLVVLSCGVIGVIIVTVIHVLAVVGGGFISFIICLVVHSRSQFDGFICIDDLVCLIEAVLKLMSTQMLVGGHGVV